jgi:hypothetical protein
MTSILLLDFLVDYFFSRAYQIPILSYLIELVSTLALERGLAVVGRNLTYLGVVSGGLSSLTVEGYTNLCVPIKSS